MFLVLGHSKNLIYPQSYFSFFRREVKSMVKTPTSRIRWLGSAHQPFLTIALGDLLFLN